LAHSKLKLEVLVRPKDIDAISTYHGLLFVRKDSGIRTAKDMRRKRFAFVDKATTAGYLLPLAYFEKREIKNYKKRADIGAAKNTVYERMARKKGYSNASSRS
jgi:phosphonate transport system substrate-binding protein